ncbi:MAG: TlpA family protein disulfide reductase [Telluria sp.]
MARAGEWFEPWPKVTAAPSLALTDLQGKTYRLEELRGRAVIVHFWASWCTSCIEELPQLDAIAGDQAVLLTVNYRDSLDTAARLATQAGLKAPVLRDRDGEAFRQWGRGVLPLTVVIDKNGVPLWRISGELKPHLARLHTILSEQK